MTEEAQGGIQPVKVPERVVDGKPTLYCFETCPFCWKVRALLGWKGVDFEVFDADWQGEAYLTVSGQNSNNSVRVPNEFMEAVSNGTDWNLYWRTELDKAKIALSAGVPIFVTEWGATHADGGVGGSSVCSSAANSWHNWMDANDIGWAAWKLDDCDWEIDTRGVADTSCLLKRDAPLNGGWTSEWLNGHASYVVGRMSD